MRKTTGLAIIGALALAAAAHAQTGGVARPIAAGGALEGRLAQAEVRHPLRLRAGETVRITARGRGFDAMLKLYGPTGTEAVAEDDDGGGGLVAEITWTAERAGLYQIAVSESSAGEDAESGGGGKQYDLTVFAATTPVVTPPRAITPNGEAIAVDMAKCGGGCQYTFSATAGERLIAETSDDDAEADPVLELRQDGDKIAENDDGGEGVNARIVRRIERTGTYTVLARTLHGGGNFKLAVSLRATPQRPAVALAIGAPAAGTITPDAEVNDDGKFYDSYTLAGRAGQRVVLDMTSTDLDTLIEVRGDTVLGNVQLAQNDDAEPRTPGRTRPASTNSRLAITFAQAGNVEVRAVSFDNKQGHYTLAATAPPAR